MDKMLYDMVIYLKTTKWYQFFFQFQFYSYFNNYFIILIGIIYHMPSHIHSALQNK